MLWKITSVCLPSFLFLNEYYYFGNPSLLHNYIFHVAPRLLDHKEIYPGPTERIESDMLNSVDSDFEFGAVTR